MLDSLAEKEQQLDNEIETRKQSLVQEIKTYELSISAQLQTKRDIFEEYKSEYFQFRLRREKIQLELNQLRQSTSYHAKSYATWRQQLLNLNAKVDSLELERRRIERDIGIYQESFNRFAKLREEARIARQQAAGDIQIVSEAKISKPLPRNTLVKTAITFFIAITLTVIAVILRHLKKSTQTLYQVKA